MGRLTLSTSAVETQPFWYAGGVPAQLVAVALEQVMTAVGAPVPVDWFTTS